MPPWGHNEGMKLVTAKAGNNDESLIRPPLQKGVQTGYMGIFHPIIKFPYPPFLKGGIYGIYLRTNPHIEICSYYVKHDIKALDIMS
jgi:hypothetical protein